MTYASAKGDTTQNRVKRAMRGCVKRECMGGDRGEKGQRKEEEREGEKK